MREGGRDDEVWGDEDASMNQYSSGYLLFFGGLASILISFWRQTEVEISSPFL